MLPPEEYKDIKVAVRVWLVAAGATVLLPCAALAQAKSSQPSDCQSHFDMLRSIHASLTSPEIYPKIAGSLATYERELLARLDRDWADKVPAAKRPSDDPGLLASAAAGRDEIAAVHRSNRGVQFRESAKFFVARNELESCLLRARQARIESAARQAVAAKASEPVPAGPLDQAALDRLSWDQLTGVYQRVISAPQADLEYARRIVQTALRRFPDNPNAPGAREVLAQIEARLSASRSPPSSPPMPPVPPQRAAHAARTEPAPPAPPAAPAPPTAPAEASRSGSPIDQAALDGLSTEELFVLLERAGQKFQHAVAGKTSWDGSVQTEKLSEDQKSSLAIIVPLMKTIFRTMTVRLPEHQSVAEWTARVEFFASIERDLGRTKAGVTMASRPDQSVLDRLDPDELSALFSEFNAKRYSSDASREGDMQIVRMALRTVIRRYPEHPFAGRAREALAEYEAQRKRRLTEIAALLPSAVPTVPASLPGSPVSVPSPASLKAAPAAARPQAIEPTFVERVWQTLLAWLGLEERAAGS